jgi:hypothetical protein
MKNQNFELRFPLKKVDFELRFQLFNRNFEARFPHEKPELGTPVPPFFKGG